ncbi:hypothetical protein PLESTM_000751600 [Pleodorina starrii]|nr:hypothetical protein PLESTM_000751600 [Pleodorina starrii]
MSDVSIVSVSDVSVNNTVEINVRLSIPASRPEDGGAAPGFEANPMSKLSAAFKSDYGLLSFTVRRAQTLSKGVLGRILQSLLPHKTAMVLSSAFRALRLYPLVKDWAVGRWKNGLIRQFMDDQLGDSIVQEVVQPLVSKLLSTSTGSIIVDTYMAKAPDAVQRILKALLQYYRVVPREWANQATLDTLLNTLSDVIDPQSQDSRLTSEGLASDTVTVLHTLIRSAASSIASETGALRQALRITPSESDALVVFLDSIDQTLNATKDALWIPEAMLADYFMTRGNSQIHQLWARTSLAAVRMFDLVNPMVDWLERQWEVTGQPLLDSLLTSSADSTYSQQFMLAQVEPVVTALNTTMDAFFHSTGVGHSIASALEARGAPKAFGQTEVLQFIAGLRSSQPERFASHLAQGVVAVLKSAVVDGTAINFVIRNGLEIAQGVIQLAFTISRPEGPLGQAAQAVQGWNQAQLDQRLVTEFLSRMGQLQLNYEQLSYNVAAFPGVVPVASYVGPSVVLLGTDDSRNGTRDVKLDLYTSKDFSVTRLTKGVCVALWITDFEGGVAWMPQQSGVVMPAPRPPLCVSDSVPVNESTRQFSATVNSLPFGAYGPGAKALRFYWYNTADGAEIASGSRVVQSTQRAFAAV